jgi:alkylation response protein AidB-like acyl-CoA dehydrogenase
MSEYRIRSPETWAKARADYLAGLPSALVCERYDLGESAFKRRARDEGWRRRDAPDPEPLPLDDDDGEDAPDLQAVAAGLLRRSLRAAAAGRLQEAARALKLHRDYLGLQATIAAGARRDAARDLEEIRRTAVALTAVAKSETAKTDVMSDALETIMARIEAPPPPPPSTSPPKRPISTISTLFAAQPPAPLPPASRRDEGRPKGRSPRPAPTPGQAGSLPRRPRLARAPALTRREAQHTSARPWRPQDDGSRSALAHLGVLGVFAVQTSPLPLRPPGADVHVMHFGPSPEQRQFQDSLTRTLDRLSPPERVRRFAESREPVARDVWAGLAELGLPALLVPEAHGGLGLTLFEAALAAEALGRVTAPAPCLGSAVLAPLALLHAGSPEQQARWLPRLAAGEAVAGVAIAEAVAGARDGAGVTADAGRLTGSALFVVDAPEADLFVVADRTGALHLVEGVRAEPLTTIDHTRRLGELRLDRTPAEPLPRDNGQALALLRDAAWVMLAADTLGAAAGMLDRAVAYAKERQQFGRVIGSFQAVKHLCAEMAAELEPARALVWYAAYAFDAAPEEASVTAAHAKAHLSEIGRFVARTATEVHGGIGFTDALGLHYAFKRIGLNRQLFGGPERVRTLAAQMQGLAA